MKTALLVVALSASFCAAQSVPPTVCPSVDLKGARLKGRFLSSSYSVKKDGREIGRIESKGDSLLFKTGAVTLFTAQVSKGPGRGHTAQVLDCEGRLVGQVEEVEATDDQAIGYTLSDASGARLGWSGRLEEGDRLSLDPAIDGRLAVVAAAMWEDAQSRHAQARNQPPQAGCGQQSPYYNRPYVGGCLPR